MVAASSERRGRVDEAAFGIVYGSITVLAFLMALRSPIDDSGRQAIILFGSVFAVAVAKAYAEICKNAFETGQPATAEVLRAAWDHSKTVLIAANGPTLIFAFAGLGLLAADQALIVAQVLALAVLAVFGLRIGWRLSGNWIGTLIGGFVTGGCGLLVSLMKYLIH